MKKNKFKISIYADGADFKNMVKLSRLEFVDGLTTNPSLMRAAGVKNYKYFAKKILKKIKIKPISFEVFSDDIEEMKKQALKISKWGKILMSKFQ